MTPPPSDRPLSQSSLLPASLRRALDSLRFEVSRVAPGGRHAERASRQRGAGIEFVDFRGYVPGDDFRALDVHAYTRHNKLVIKQYEEPQDLPLYVLLDVSQSMRLPGPDPATASAADRFQFAKLLAAAFGYVGLVNEDRVAVLPFADLPLPPLRPLSGRNVVGRLLDYLARLGGGRGTQLVRALDDLRHRARRPGVVVIISDFFDQENLDAIWTALRRLPHKVAIVLLRDESELASLPEGDLLLEDCETGETVAVTVTPAAREAYQRADRAFAGEIASGCRRHGYTLVHAPVGDSPTRIVADVVKTLR